MQTRRDHLQAYQFAMGRLSTALLTGDPGRGDRPGRRAALGTVLGTGAVLLLCAGFGVYGLISPPVSDSWRTTGTIVMERQTGTRYLFLDGTLRPVRNYASALLILGKGATLREVSAKDLGRTPHGAPVGIAGAPDALPAADALTGAVWTRCLAPTGVGATGAGSGAERVDFAPAAGSTPLPADRQLLLTGPDGSRSLLWRGVLHPVPDPAALIALGLDGDRPHAAPKEWLAALPVGAPLTAAPIIGSGNPAAAVAGRATVVGQTFRTSAAGTGRAYVMTSTGVAPIGPTEAALLAARPGALSTRQVTAADMAAAPVSATAPGADLPEVLDAPKAPPAPRSLPAPAGPRGADQHGGGRGPGRRRLPTSAASARRRGGGGGPGAAGPAAGQSADLPDQRPGRGLPARRRPGPSHPRPRRRRARAAARLAARRPAAGAGALHRRGPTHRPGRVNPMASMRAGTAAPRTRTLLPLRLRQAGDAMLVHPKGGADPQALAFAQRLASDTQHTLVVVDLPFGALEPHWQQLARLLDGLPGTSLRLVFGRATPQESRHVGRLLAERLRRTVLAPDGELLPTAHGGLFIPADYGAGWLRMRPGRPLERDSLRFPKPMWEFSTSDQPWESSPYGVVEAVPSGVWVRSARPSPPLAGWRRLVDRVPSHPQLMNVVLGSPGGPAVPLDDIVRVWDTVMHSVRSWVRFIHFGPVALPEGGVSVGQELADAIGRQVVLYAGMPTIESGDGSVGSGRVRIMGLRGDGSPGWSPFAAELVYSPRGADGEAPPPSLAGLRHPVTEVRQLGPGVYQYAADAVLEVISSGLWIRPVVDPSGADEVRRLPCAPGHPVILYDRSTPATAERMRALAQDMLWRLDPESREAFRVAPADAPGLTAVADDHAWTVPPTADDWRAVAAARAAERRPMHLAPWISRAEAGAPAIAPSAPAAEEARGDTLDPPSPERPRMWSGAATAPTQPPSRSAPAPSPKPPPAARPAWTPSTPRVLPRCHQPLWRPAPPRRWWPPRPDPTIPPPPDPARPRSPRGRTATTTYANLGRTARRHRYNCR
ncbi:type VII secretion protein EccB [Streptacidiphilus sp. PAMC 29251]